MLKLFDYIGRKLVLVGMEETVDSIVPGTIVGETNLVTISGAHYSCADY